MNYKRILGIVIFLCGVALVIISVYIKNQVDEGKLKIAKAEKQVEGGKKIFSLNPVTKEVGKKVVIDPAERKIAKGKQDVNYYERMSGRLMIIGIVCGALGVLVFLFGKKKRSS